MKTKHTEGYTRRKIRNKFKYYDPSGQVIEDAKILKRIGALVIPPNWKKVWISRSPRSNLQAYGYDQKGRKQYIYHPKFVNHQQSEKFKQILYAGQYLQELRKISSRQLKQETWNMEKLCAVAFKIMDSTLIRIGNKRYTLAYKSYGLSTLEKRHVKISGNTITLAYKGKKGVFQEKTWRNKQLACLLGQLMQIKGKTVFCLDKTNCEGRFCGRTFNSYLRTHCPGNISCKDIRIWGASREAFKLLCKAKQPDEPKARKRQLNSVIKAVAKELGNTKAVSEKYYVHPTIQRVYMESKFPVINKEIPLEKLEFRLFRFLLKYS